MPIPFDPQTLELLRAALDRLVPRDADAGACDGGVVEYVSRRCGADPAERRLLELGLAQLERTAREQSGCSFAALREPEQDELLLALERQTLAGAPAGFFERLLHLAMEGFYADPENGGNRGGVSWAMVGYDPRRPTRLEPE